MIRVQQKKRWSTTVIIAGCFFFYGQLSAQSTNGSEKKFSLTGFPVLYYTPETRLAFGLAGSLVLHRRDDKFDNHVSQFQVGLAYTLNQQFLLYIPFRYYVPGEKYVIYGEAGYYRYSYYFYGIGNSQPRSEKELYSVNYPRIRVNALRQLSGTVYLGLRFGYENYDIVKTEPGKELASDPTITGAAGGHTVGFGPAINYDTRDDLFAPAIGWFVDAAYQYYGKASGSNFNYNRYTIDASHYFPMGGRKVLALNVFLDAVSGNAPFNQLALLGGNRKMRGLYEGRYRDKDMVVLGAEYRFPFTHRVGGALFLNEGSVNDQLNTVFVRPRFSYGAGLRYRLKKTEKLNLRLDYALARHSSGIYFTIGEAF